MPRLSRGIVTDFTGFPLIVSKDVYIELLKEITHFVFFFVVLPGARSSRG